MPKFEYIAPAVQRLRDLCTNGLFLNLREFPEPLKSAYQRLREEIRESRLAGAGLALIDMAQLCLRFPALAACARILRSDAPAESVGRALRHFHNPEDLAVDLREFLRQNPDETTSLLVAALAEACYDFAEGGLWDWANRPTAGSFSELSRSETASELITQLGVLNRYLQKYLRFYSHLKEDPDSTVLTYDCLGVPLSVEPFLFRKDGDLYLTEEINSAAGKLLCRNTTTLRRSLFDMPDAIRGLPIEPLQLNHEHLASHVQTGYQSADYLRPAYLDRWLRQALDSKGRGYLLLEGESGLGKSIYTSMLDPVSPLYMNTTLFEDTYTCRYVISLYPDSQRPSRFIAALNAMFPMLPPITWTEEAPDLRRRVAEFLNAAVRGTASGKLLLILDGAHHLDYSGQNAFSLAEILPQASQLTQGVYLLLTDQCAEDHSWLMTKDAAPHIGTFLLSTPQHQQFFRVYLTQYVLHVPTEDNPLVSALSESLRGDMLLAHLLRDTFVLCRPDSYTNMVHFYEQHPGYTTLTALYLDRLYEFYGPEYSIYIAQLLQLLALSPHAVSWHDLETLLIDLPALPAIASILRDLRPFLSLRDDTLSLASTRIHYYMLSAYSPDWKDYCLRLLQYRSELLDAAPDNPEYLLDLDYYAKGIGWAGHEELLTHIAHSLLPSPEHEETLSPSIIDYYTVLGEFFSDETTNPFRLDSLRVFSLSPILSDRRFACNRWDSLQDTPQFDEKAYARCCRRYTSMLSRQNPLCTATIEALAAFRRKSELLYDYAFLWHPERLQRGRLAEALQDASAFSHTSDPCNLPWIQERLPELIRLAEDDLQNPLPQECAVLTHLLITFCEGYLRALLPILCDRDSLSRAGTLFSWMQEQLLRVYRCRARLFRAIREYSLLLLPEEAYGQALYAPDPQEADRAELLATDLRLWLHTFSERQLLQYFRENTPLWRVEEAMLRLESIHALSAKEYSLNPRTVRAQIESMSPAEGLELADRWYQYTCASLCSSRSRIPAGRASDLCAVQLVRAELLAQLDKKQDLHSCIMQLRFFLEHGSLSSKRLLDTVCALGSHLLAADTLARYSSAQALVAFYAHLNSLLQKGRSFMTLRQIASVQAQLKESFPQCMLSQHFYAYLIPAQAKINALHNGAESCRQAADAAKDPVDAIIALQALVICSSDKEEPRKMYLERLLKLLTEDPFLLPPALLDYCAAQVQELGAPAALAAPLYQVWLHYGAPDLALMGMDGQVPSAERLLYRRLAGCFLTDHVPVDPVKLTERICTETESPVLQAFTLLCTAILAGTRSIHTAYTLAESAFHLLGDFSADELPLAQELTKVQLIALCLDDSACLDALPELVSRWKALQNSSPRPLAFRTYTRLWPTRLTYPVPESLSDL